MNIQMLIDSIVQQTTVLIGQLATAAGIRAPLAHIADQVFVELAQELRTQGVPGRVAAGMFGMPLRSYQKRLRRLKLSETREGASLWEAVFGFVREGGNVRRSTILRHFRRDPEREIGAVLNDLVGSGLLTQTGRGEQAVYAPTSEAGLEVLRRGGDRDSMLELVWLTVSDQPGLTEKQIQERYPDWEAVSELLEQLVREGKIQRLERDGETTYSAQTVLIPVGAEAGWEVAVFDHYRALVNAIAAKLRQGNTRSSSSDETGGATLSFELYPGHPFEARVRSLLERERQTVNELWQDVERHNTAHALPEDSAYRVYFYCGQYVESEEE